MTENQHNVTPAVDGSTSGNAAAGHDEDFSTPAWLKILVVVLGIAIVVVGALLVHRILNKATDNSAEGKGRAEASVPSAGFKAGIDVPLQPGERILTIIPDGALLYVHVRGRMAKIRILRIDQRTGDIGEITFSHDKE